MLYDDRDSDSLLDADQLQQLNSASPPTQGMSFFKFFRFISSTDRALLYIGTFSAVVAGMILPSISLIMGNVAVAFTAGGSSSGGDTDPQDMMNFIANYVILIATSMFIFAYIFFSFWQHLAENITTDLRKRYLAALMRQEVGFFEMNKVEEIPAQMAEIFDNIQGSIGEKISNLIFAVSTCLSGICYAIYFGPYYAAVCLAYLPLLLIILAVFGRMV